MQQGGRRAKAGVLLIATAAVVGGAVLIGAPPNPFAHQAKITAQGHLQAYSILCIQGGSPPRKDAPVASTPIAAIHAAEQAGIVRSSDIWTVVSKAAGSETFLSPAGYVTVTSESSGQWAVTNLNACPS